MYKLSSYNIIKEYDEFIIVYNSYSKASLILEKDSDTSAFVNINSFNNQSEEIKNILINNGFVINSERDELAEIKYMYQKKFYDSRFFNIVLVPSLSCNFSCPYCFEKGLKCGKENINNYFSALKNFALKEFKKHEYVQISLFGGEPLLFYSHFVDFLKFVDSDSKRENYKYFSTIVTNGSLLSDEVLNGLLLYNLNMLQITIDSDKETHDKTRRFKNGKPSFDLLVKKIEFVADRISNLDSFNFVLRINLSNTSVIKVKESLQCIDAKFRPNINLLFRSIYNTHAYNNNNINSNDKIYEYISMGKQLGFKILQDGFKFQSCEACADNKFFYLLPDLSLWKCINDLNYKKACIGKMKCDGELKFKSQEVVNWADHAMKVFEDEECLKCKLLPDCYGGCILRKCKTCNKQCRPFEMVSMYHVFK